MAKKKQQPGNHLEADRSVTPVLQVSKARRIHAGAWLTVGGAVLLTAAFLVVFVIPFKPAITTTAVEEGTTSTVVPSETLWDILRPGKENVPDLPTGEELAHPKTPYIGVYTPNPAAIADFEALTGVKTNMQMFFKNWANQGTFKPAEYVAAYKSGRLPVISWEPWDPSGSPTEQPAYQLSAIANGAYDGLITNWAKGIAAMNVPVGIRFAHEMNGHWYPWAVTENGNLTADYVAAWRHIHDIFQAEGATHVMWIWSPNINRFLADQELVKMYPGDEYVDAVAATGYGTRAGDSFDSTLGSTIGEIRTFTNKPFLLSETAADDDIDKPAWIASMFDAFVNDHSIIGLIWFNEAKRANWTIDSAPGSVEAFSAGVARLRESWAAAAQAAAPPAAVQTPEP